MAASRSRYFGTMDETATIRVPRTTRNQLGALASEVDPSMPDHVSELARQQRRASFCAADLEDIGHWDAHDAALLKEQIEALRDSAQTTNPWEEAARHRLRRTPSA